MKTEDLFLINGIGYLDLPKIGLKGPYKSVDFTIYATRKNRRKTNGQLYKTVKRRLVDEISIKFGLTLVQPLHMPYLVHELLMINEKNKKSCTRTVRIDEAGTTITHTRGNSQDTAFKPYLMNFFMMFKKELKASHLNCWVNCSSPGYIEIKATIERTKFDFPARFIINMVKLLNYDLAKEKSNS